MKRCYEEFAGQQESGSNKRARTENGLLDVPDVTEHDYINYKAAMREYHSQGDDCSIVVTAYINNESYRYAATDSLPSVCVRLFLEFTSYAVRAKATMVHVCADYKESRKSVTAQDVRWLKYLVVRLNATYIKLSGYWGDEALQYMATALKPYTHIKVTLEPLGNAPSYSRFLDTYGHSGLVVYEANMEHPWMKSHMLHKAVGPVHLKVAKASVDHNNIETILLSLSEVIKEKRLFGAAIDIDSKDVASKKLLERYIQQYFRNDHLIYLRLSHNNDVFIDTEHFVKQCVTVITAYKGGINNTASKEYEKVNLSKLKKSLAVLKTFDAQLTSVELMLRYAHNSTLYVFTKHQIELEDFFPGGLIDKHQLLLGIQPSHTYLYKLTQLVTTTRTALNYLWQWRNPFCTTMAEPGVVQLVAMTHFSIQDINTAAVHVTQDFV